MGKSVFKIALMGNLCLPNQKFGVKYIGYILYLYIYVLYRYITQTHTHTHTHTIYS